MPEELSSVEDEFAVIGKLLRRGKEAGVLVEVVAAYVAERMSGYAPDEALMHALSEWDA